MGIDPKDSRFGPLLPLDGTSLKPKRRLWKHFWDWNLSLGRYLSLHALDQTINWPTGWTNRKRVAYAGWTAGHTYIRTADRQIRILLLHMTWGRKKGNSVLKGWAADRIDSWTGWDHSLTEDLLDIAPSKWASFIGIPPIRSGGSYRGQVHSTIKWDRNECKTSKACKAWSSEMDNLRSVEFRP